MKDLYLFRNFPLFLIGVGFLFNLPSCNKDEEQVNPPILTLTSADLVDGVYTTDETAAVEINVSVNALNGFNVLRISYDGIDKDTDEIIRTETGQTTLDVAYKLEDIVYGSSGTFTITFQAVDDTNQTTEQAVIVQPAMPTIELTEDNFNVQDGILNAEVGSTFNLRYRYTFPAGFGQFKITLSDDGTTSETLVTELPPTQGNAVTDAIIFSFDQSYLDHTISYTFDLTDVLGNTAQLIVPVNLTQPPAKIYTAVLLAAPTDDENSKTFFSTNLGQTFSVADVSGTTENISKEIDFGYYFGANDRSSLAGPANFPTSIYNLGPNGENWKTLNVMNFKRTSLTTAQFNEFTENSQTEIESAYETATGDVKLIITNLQEGEIIAFKTDLKNNKNPKGLLKVVKITGTDGSDGSIEIEVIVNQ